MAVKLDLFRILTIKIISTKFALQYLEESRSIRWRLVYAKANKTKQCQQKMGPYKLANSKTKEIKTYGKSGSIN